MNTWLTVSKNAVAVGKNSVEIVPNWRSPMFVCLMFAADNKARNSPLRCKMSRSRFLSCSCASVGIVRLSIEKNKNIPAQNKELIGNDLREIPECRSQWKQNQRLIKFLLKFENNWVNNLMEVVMAGSLVAFKAKLDHHLRNVRAFVWAAAFPLFIAILDITGNAGWQYGKRKL